MDEATVPGVSGRRGPARELDLVLYGATGEIGTRAAQHILRCAPRGLRWAIAGRNRSKLEGLMDDLRSRGTDALAVNVSIVVADIDGIDAVAGKTRTLANVAGPYHLFGEPIVKACIRNGTDYVDINGELNFMRDMIERYGDEARRNNVAVVFSCGFDCVIGDIGTYALVKHSKARYNCGLQEVSSVFVFLGAGGFGTAPVASFLGVLGDRESFEPFSLQADIAEPDKYTEALPDLHRVCEVPETGLFGAFLLVAMTNVRNIRRSASLYATTPGTELQRIDGNCAYSGGKFRYREMMGFSSRPAAVAMNALVTVAVRATELMLQIPGLRSAAVKFLSQNSIGPSDEAIASGGLEVTLIGKTDEASPRTVIGRIRCGDPGFTETSRFLAESSVLLATQRDSLPLNKFGCGMLTPAAAFGDHILGPLSRDGPWLEILGD